MSGQRWQCPKCGGWVAWWVHAHYCKGGAYSTTTNQKGYGK